MQKHSIEASRIEMNENPVGASKQEATRALLLDPSFSSVFKIDADEKLSYEENPLHHLSGLKTS